MKKISFFILLLTASFIAQAQDYNVSLHAPRPKVGVVLGGGGAKGASHIGVLKYIEEMGIPIDYVAGTSMGSIIGGLYAMGYSPDELTHLISHLDWSAYIGNKIDRTMMSEEVRTRTSTTLLNIPFGLNYLLDKDPKSSIIDQLPTAYVNNSSLVNLFNDLCIGYQEEMDFNDMPIPFACVATDLVTGDEVVLRSGVMPTAMRASMAIPGVFAPVQIDDKILVDGGLVNNFPADVLRDMGADIIIGIEVTSEQEIQPEELKSLPRVLARLVTNSTNAKRKENREICNIRLVPDVSGFGMLSFTPAAIDTLVGRGYKMAQKYHDQFQAIKDALSKTSQKPPRKELHAPKAQNLASDSVLITSIEITGVTEEQSNWLIRKGQLEIGRKYMQDDIERSASIYRGTGCFDDITYTVKENDSLHLSDANLLSEAYNLTFNMTPSHPHVVGVGIRYDTEEGAGLLFNIGLNEKKFGGSKLNLSAKLSYNPKIIATYTYSRSSLANFNIGYEYRDEHFALLKEGNERTNLHYHQHKANAYISQFHLLNFSAIVGASYVYTHFDQTSLENESDYDTLFRASHMITPHVNLKYDNLDNAYFAKRGIYARLSSKLFIEPGVNQPLPFDICYAFRSYLTPGGGKLTFIPQIYGRLLFNGNFHFDTWNQIGGEIESRHFEQQMPFIGFNGSYSIGDYATILRLDMRYNIYGKHYLTAMYNALFELAQDFLPDSHGAGLKYSYNSLFGPISLTGLWSTTTKVFSAYFSIGYTF